MRLVVRVFNRTVFEVSTEADEPSPPGNPGTTAGQFEIGFTPSLPGEVMCELRSKHLSR